MTYEQVLEFLFGRLPMYQKIGKEAFKKDLSNTLDLLQLLGNPHKKYPTIHIAGTNGKGTVAHSLASILQEAGYSTGLYTSPHLKSYRERIRFNGALIEEAYVVEFVERLEKEILRIEPSFFEITVVMALSYFAEKSVDVAVIETGLGGRLDSTNVIIPSVSVITSIGYDHQDMLGDSLAEIAGEKAGIIKPNVPCVVGSNIAEEALEVIRNKASSSSAPLNTNSSLWKVEGSDESLCKVTNDGNEDSSYGSIGDQGFSFRVNLPTILETVKELNALEYAIDDESVKNGLNNLVRNTGLKGRWQVLSHDPKIICDVGHNEDGIRLIMDQIGQESYDHLHIVFGTVRGKDLSKILPLLDKTASYYFCQANVPRALPTSELCLSARHYGLVGEGFNSVSEAVEAARLNAGNRDMIFIGGSTFVVAEIDNL